MNFLPEPLSEKAVWEGGDNYKSSVEYTSEGVIRGSEIR